MADRTDEQTIRLIIEAAYGEVESWPAGCEACQDSEPFDRTDHEEDCPIGLHQEALAALSRLVGDRDRLQDERDDAATALQRIIDIEPARAGTHAAELASNCLQRLGLRANVGISGTWSSLRSRTWAAEAERDRLRGRLEDAEQLARHQAIEIDHPELSHEEIAKRAHQTAVSCAPLAARLTEVVDAENEAQAEVTRLRDALEACAEAIAPFANPYSVYADVIAVTAALSIARAALAVRLSVEPDEQKESGDGTAVSESVECPGCDGRGWNAYATHHRSCNGMCAEYGCPVQEQEECGACGGTGQRTAASESVKSFVCPACGEPELPDVVGSQTCPECGTVISTLETDAYHRRRAEVGLPPVAFTTGDVSSPPDSSVLAARLEATTDALRQLRASVQKLNAVPGLKIAADGLTVQIDAIIAAVLDGTQPCA